MSPPPSARPRLARRMRVALVVALFVAGLTTYSAVVRSDAPMPDDADLLIDLTPIPPADNGVIHVLAAWRRWGGFPPGWQFDFAALPGLDPNDGTVDFRAAEHWRTSVLAEDWPGLEEEIAPIIAAFGEGLRFPAVGLIDPQHPDPLDSADLRGLLELIDLRTRVALLEGRHADAIRDAIVLLEWGEHGSRAPRTAFEAFFALSFVRAADRVFGQAVEDPQLPDAELERIADALRTHRLDPELPIRMLRGEYSLIRRALTEDVPVTWNWKPGVTFTALAEELRVWIAHCDGPLWPFPNVTRDVGSTRFESWNLSGKSVFEHHIAGWQRILEGWANARVDHDSARIRVAIERYRRAHRTLPSTLDALVPTFLATVPIDPFDERPLRYDPVRAMLWSVGTDGADGGGSGREGSTDPAEPTYRVGTRKETRAPSGSPR